MTTQLAAHHTHDGLYFARAADGSVFVWMVWEEDGATVKRTVNLGENEWASVVREMEEQRVPADLSDGAADEPGERE